MFVVRLQLQLHEFDFPVKYLRNNFVDHGNIRSLLEANQDFRIT